MDGYGIPCLRDTSNSPDDKKKEASWRKIGLPISKYNEIVHRNYKLNFEDL